MGQTVEFPFAIGQRVRIVAEGINIPAKVIGLSIGEAGVKLAGVRWVNNQYGIEEKVFHCDSLETVESKKDDAE